MSALTSKHLSNQQMKRTLLILQGLIAAIIGIGAFCGLWRSGFDLEALLGHAQETPPYLFFLVMAILPLVGFPVSLLYLYAGIAFTPPFAFVLTMVGVAGNLLLSFALTHSILHAPLEACAQSLGYKLPKIPQHHYWKATFLIRLLPATPFFIQNYLLALTHLPLKLFFWPALAIQAGFAAAFIFLGESFARENLSYVLTAFVGIFIIMLSLQALRHKRKSRMPGNNNGSQVDNQ